MNRILFDTSVYGKLIEDLEVVEKIGKLIPKELVVYGTKIIRKELRGYTRTIFNKLFNERHEFWIFSGFLYFHNQFFPFFSFSQSFHNKDYINQSLKNFRGSG